MNTQVPIPQQVLKTLIDADWERRGFTTLGEAAKFYEVGTTEYGSWKEPAKPCGPNLRDHGKFLMCMFEKEIPEGRTIPSSQVLISQFRKTRKGGRGQTREEFGKAYGLSKEVVRHLEGGEGRNQTISLHTHFTLILDILTWLDREGWARFSYVAPKK